MPELKDIFDVPLPSINYHDDKDGRSSKSSIKKKNNLYPEKILLWEDFEVQRRQLIENTYTLNKVIEDLPNVQMPGDFKVKSEDDLYPLFDDSVFILFKRFISESSESSIEIENLPQIEIPKTINTTSMDSKPVLPDYIVSLNKQNEDFLFPIEIKTKWKLGKMKEPEDIHTLYNNQIEKYKQGSRDELKYSKNPDVVPLVLQIYKYMLHGNFFYGILTTYENTWVIKFEENKDAVETVYISRKIQKSELIRTLVYVFSLTFNGEGGERKRFVPFNSESRPMLQK